jgi:hypothetical protein
MFANSEKEATLTIALAANSTATYLLCDACQFLKKAGRTLIHVLRN